MTEYLGARWDEWFALAMTVVVLGLPLFFLFLALKRHHFDDPDCSKYNMFTSDPSIRPGEQPSMPASCQPKYLSKRPWWNSVNMGWIWVTVGLAALYFLITVIVFAASRGFSELRQSLPM